MKTGILLCGLNGAGKSTLGKALAEELNALGGKPFHFIDNENLYFPKTDPDYVYAIQRTREEVEKLLLDEIQAHENFIFTSVKGDYSEAVRAHFRYAVLVAVPRDIRLQRIRNRSLQQFGDRALPGGDLYDRQEDFFHFAAARAEDTVEEWIKVLDCPILRVDGTRPIAENTALIIEQL